MLCASAWAQPSITPYQVRQVWVPGPLFTDPKADAEQPLFVNDPARVLFRGPDGDTTAVLEAGTLYHLLIVDHDADVSADRDKLLLTLATAVSTWHLLLNETAAHSGEFSGVVMLRESMWKTEPPPVSLTTTYPTAAERPLPESSLNLVLPVAFQTNLCLLWRQVPGGKWPTAEIPFHMAVMTMTHNAVDTLNTQETLLLFAAQTMITLGTADDRRAPDAQPEHTFQQEACRMLTTFAERCPANPTAPKALLIVGRFRQSQRRLADAQRVFASITEADQKNPAIADNLMFIAQVMYEQKDYLESARMYDRLIDRFPEYLKIEQARYYAALSYYYAGEAGDAAQLDVAINRFLAFVAQYPQNLFAGDALYWAANAYMDKLNTQEAKNLLTRMVTDYPRCKMYSRGKRLLDRMKI